MHLSDLLTSDHQNTDNPIVTGVSSDSRQISDGFVFVAIKGISIDGNQFINDAISKGAAAIITDQDVSNAQVPVIKVDDSRLALAQIASRVHSNKPNLLATVTGTNGKTSVAEFVRQIWQRMGWQASSIGTLNT